MKNPTKADLIRKYSEREPRKFAQIDCWKDADGIMGRDLDDGHGLTGMLTFELMNGSDVRVLVAEGIQHDTVAFLLRKAAEWVERGIVKELLRPHNTRTLLNNIQETVTPDIGANVVPFRHRRDGGSA